MKKNSKLASNEMKKLFATWFYTMHGETNKQLGNVSYFCRFLTKNMLAINYRMLS